MSSFWASLIFGRRLLISSILCVTAPVEVAEDIQAAEVNDSGVVEGEEY
jgi:hypothetical protein